MNDVMPTDADAALEKLRAFVVERGGSIQPVDMGEFYSREGRTYSSILKGKVRAWLQIRPNCGLVFDPGLDDKQEQHQIRAVSGPNGNVPQTEPKAADEAGALKRLRAFVLGSGGSITPNHMGAFYKDEPACADLLRGNVRNLVRKWPNCGLVFDPGPDDKPEQHQIRAVSGPNGNMPQPNINAGAGTSTGHGASLRSSPPPRPGPPPRSPTPSPSGPPPRSSTPSPSGPPPRSPTPAPSGPPPRSSTPSPSGPPPRSPTPAPSGPPPRSSTPSPSGPPPRTPQFPPPGQPPFTPTYLPSGVEYELVSTLSRLQELIATDEALGGDEQTTVAIDCEGVPEELQLMQIATPQGVAVIDCGTIGPRRVCEALLPLLTSNRTLKLMHDLKMDAVAIHTLGGVALAGCIDSQLCMEAVTGQVHMGFNAMLKDLGLDAHPTKRRVHASMSAGNNIFAARPLPAHLVEYAALDASLLYDCAGVLLDRLEQLQEHKVSVSVLRTASDARARLAISAMAEFGPEAARRRRVCFDAAHGYRLASRELLEAWRPGDLHGGTPIVVFDDVSPLLALLPKDIATSLLAQTEAALLCDINLDVGRQPHAWCAGQRVFLSSEARLVSRSDIQHVVEQLGSFGSDNRAGLEAQLHRISAIMNRERVPIGLTMRVGRHVQGNADMMADILLGRDGMPVSVLLLGEPGSGKTTVVREAARVLAERCNVLIVDTSNEIAGDGDVPHPCVGHARRMQVRSLSDQGHVMVEGVQNHTPEVMVIDEIGRTDEVEAARTCKARGVRIVASAHGDLRKLVQNRALRGLIGGLEHVTLGDAQAAVHAKSRGFGGAEAVMSSKVVTKRGGPPIFEVIIEMRRGKQDEWLVVTSAADAVDAILDGRKYSVQRRTRDRATGHVFMALERA